MSFTASMRPSTCTIAARGEGRAEPARADERVEPAVLRRSARRDHGGHREPRGPGGSHHRRRAGFLQRRRPEGSHRGRRRRHRRRVQDPDRAVPPADHRHPADAQAGHRRRQRPGGRDRAVPRAGLRPGGGGRVRVFLARLRQHRSCARRRLVAVRAVPGGLRPGRRAGHAGGAAGRPYRSRLGPDQPGLAGRGVPGAGAGAARPNGGRRHQVLRRDQAPAQQVAVRAHGRTARVRGRHPEGNGRLRRLRRGTGGLRREAGATVQRGLSPPVSAIVDTAQLERVYRAEAPRITAALAARIGDVGLAADAVQDAFVEALEHWRDAPPPNPGGWLATTARRKAIDRLRRARAGQAKLALLAATATDACPETEAADDELLGMVFACCHPALPRESQIALTLRAVCGLTTAEIAAAFLAAEPAMTQRLSRARKALQAAHADMRIPDPDHLADRLAEVLAVVYLVFNEGYLASAGRQPARRDLAAQAVSLTRLLHRLMPREPEVLGLLALLLLHESRAATRFDGWGRLVRLADQDRTRWNRALIAEATGLLDRALTQRASGPYQVQAAIAALHADAPDYEHTDWRQIRILYDRLHQLTPSPVVLLNRAVATRYVVGPEAALAEITPLAAELDGYRLFHALRAGLLTGLGRDDEAREASERALALAGNPAERELLARRLSF